MKNKKEETAEEVTYEDVCAEDLVLKTIPCASGVVTFKLANPLEDSYWIYTPEEGIPVVFTSKGYTDKSEAHTSGYFYSHKFGREIRDASNEPDYQKIFLNYGVDLNPKAFSTISHDFGTGPVPAHQHKNGGGWVANTTQVADSAWVGPDCAVWGTAVVGEKVLVTSKSMICGEANIKYGALIKQGSVIYDSATIGEGAIVGGNSQVGKDTLVAPYSIVEKLKVANGEESAMLKEQHLLDGRTVYPNANGEWVIMGSQTLHHISKPARYADDGTPEYYLNGFMLSKESWELAVKEGICPELRSEKFIAWVNDAGRVHNPFGGALVAIGQAGTDLLKQDGFYYLNGCLLGKGSLDYIVKNKIECKEVSSQVYEFFDEKGLRHTPFGEMAFQGEYFIHGIKVTLQQVVDFREDKLRCDSYAVGPNYVSVLKENNKAASAQVLAFCQWDKDLSLRTEEYWNHGLLHREDGPARIEYHADGKISREFFYYNGRHVDSLNDVIALVAADKDNEAESSSLEAETLSDGTRVVRRVVNGLISWMTADGKPHHTGRPAVTGANGLSQYWLNGVSITKLQWEVAIAEKITPTLSDAGVLEWRDEQGLLHNTISSAFGEKYYLRGIEVTKEQLSDYESGKIRIVVGNKKIKFITDEQLHNEHGPALVTRPGGVIKYHYLNGVYLPKADWEKVVAAGIAPSWAGSMVWKTKEGLLHNPYSYAIAEKYYIWGRELSADQFKSWTNGDLMIGKRELGGKNGFVVEEKNKFGQHHSEFGPCYMKYKVGVNGAALLIQEEYGVNGAYHREDGPALITYDAEGRISLEEYYLNGTRLCRADWEVERAKYVTDMPVLARAVPNAFELPVEAPVLPSKAVPISAIAEKGKPAKVAQEGLGGAMGLAVGATLLAGLMRKAKKTKSPGRRSIISDKNIVVAQTVPAQ